jgi:hypothetical protein
MKAVRIILLLQRDNDERLSALIKPAQATVPRPSALNGLFRLQSAGRRSFGIACAPCVIPRIAIARSFGLFISPRP